MRRLLNGRLSLERQVLLWGSGSLVIICVFVTDAVSSVPLPGPDTNGKSRRRVRMRFCVSAFVLSCRHGALSTVSGYRKLVL